MRRKIHDFGLICLVTALAAVLAGCATAPPPIQLMDRAQSEIHAARSAGAATAAPESLAEAERRLAAAQQFAANDDNGKATDKAQEAEAAAATAHARADAAKLDREIRQQTQVNAGLQADLERRQAAAAAAQRAVVARQPAPASSNAVPAPASSIATPSSAGGNTPVTLPPIQLGQPVTPASTGGAPAPASTAGNPDSGVRP